MSLYDDCYELRFKTVVLKNRVIVACAKAATDILNEDPLTENHANRVIWAQEVLRNAPAKAEEMLWGVVANAAVRTAYLPPADPLQADDNVAQNAVNGLINSFAIGE